MSVNTETISNKLDELLKIYQELTKIPDVNKELRRMKETLGLMVEVQEKLLQLEEIQASVSKFKSSSKATVISTSHKITSSNNRNDEKSNGAPKLKSFACSSGYYEAPEEDSPPLLLSNGHKKTHHRNKS